MRHTDPADGLPVTAAGGWAEDKYRHVEHYARMFARSMKGKWDCRSYLELFAGAGRVAIKGSDRIIDAASLRALAIEPPFDAYAYGELNAELLRALERRSEVRRQDSRRTFVQGDVNETWPQLRDRIVGMAQGGRYLTFCFVDPYRCADLAFATLAGLAELFIDFLVLIPSYMDANRNQSTYTQTSSPVLDRFLGGKAWREVWNERSGAKDSFGSFVADRFGVGLRDLGFKYDGLTDMKLVRSTDKNLPLYHLAFFSRHELGLKLWREAVKFSNPQRELF